MHHIKTRFGPNCAKTRLSANLALFAKTPASKNPNQQKDVYIVNKLVGVVASNF